jgi:hypothetical protein
MNVSFPADAILKINDSEREHSVRPFELWPLLLVASIVAFIVMSSDTATTSDPHVSSPYLQSGMAP